ncbi:MAG: KOW domain-containing RNA-binding protein [Bacillota bacterium]
MEPRLGQVVVSIAGRDRGRRYIVTGIVDRTFVIVADGIYRRVSNPKKKNVRHLMMTRKADGRIGSKILAGAGVTDEEVREALKEFEDGYCKRAGWPHE